MAIKNMIAKGYHKMLDGKIMKNSEHKDASKKIMKRGK
jgi:hypothetical protein